MNKTKLEEEYRKPVQDILGRRKIMVKLEIWRNELSDKRIRLPDTTIDRVEFKYVLSYTGKWIKSTKFKPIDFKKVILIQCCKDYDVMLAYDCLHIYPMIYKGNWDKKKRKEREVKGRIIR